MKLSKTTTSVYVRRFRLVETPELTDYHQQSINVQNELWNFTNKYLEATYGYKHLNRKFVSTVIQKRYILNAIKVKFAQHKGLLKWSPKLGLHSQAADELLKIMLTNFGQYRRVLYKASLMTIDEKLAYKNNEHSNNRQNRSWYRKGSLNFLRNGASFKTISLPSNGQIEIKSAHHIKIQGFGIVQVVENIKNLKGSKIVISKVKRKNNGQFELQLVFTQEIKRLPQQPAIGVDWNMHNDELFRTSVNQVIKPNVIVFNQADRLEDAINQLKSLRDKTTWLNSNSKRISTMNNQIRFLNIKRNNILDEEYKQLAHQLLDNNNVVVLENLDSKDMRSVKRTNKAANRKLAKVKPYALQSFITSLANKTGKTLVKVDAYKTSQVEYGTEFEQKHKLDEKIELSNGEIVRGWKSLTGDNSIVIRDLNAAKNILAWGVKPEKHIKLKDYPNLKPSSLVSVN